MFGSRKPINVVLILACFLSAGSASAYGQLCPTIEVKTPPGLINPGDSFLVSASVNNASDLGELTYSWTVSDGVTYKEEAPFLLTILTTRGSEGRNITVSVKISGLPDGCSDTASETIGVASLPIICNDFEYSTLDKYEVRGIVDNVFIQLSNNPDMTATFLVAFADTEPISQRKLRIKQILDAVAFRKYDIKRVRFFLPNASGHSGTIIWTLRSDFDRNEIFGDGEMISGAEMKRKLPTLFNNK